MKTSIGSKGQVKESPIDQRYRLLLLHRYLKNAKEVAVASGGSKWVFCCPFCSPLARTESKRIEHKGALVWNDLQNYWAFFCAKKGSPQCSGCGKTLEKFLRALDPELAEQYRIDQIGGTQEPLVSKDNLVAVSARMAGRMLCHRFRGADHQHL